MAGKYRRPTTPKQREAAAEARETKLAALHQTLSDQVTALAAGPQWRRWLDVAAKFHSYSFNNTVLLMAQNPAATHVAGYNVWRELGRQVNKGEKGLAILAPVTRKNEPADEAAHDADANSTVVDQPEAPADTSRRVVGFRPAYVWDISQTTGDPLPEPPAPVLLAGQAPEGLWDALAAQCAAAGFTVERRPIAGAEGPNGYTAYAAREVVVRSDVDDLQAVKTLIHELGHVLMHDPSSFVQGDTSGCRGSREVEAESVAYLVAADHGLDTSEYTFAYVAGWAAQAGDVGETLRATGAQVLATAHQVLEGTHAYLSPVSAEAAARVAVDADQLAARAALGAQRTATVRSASVGAATIADGPSGARLLAANDAAIGYFRSQYASSWAPAYLDRRIGTSLLVDQAPGVGHAPAGWTNLIDHLRSDGFTDAEIVGAGLGTRASTGRLVDRFRDRLMFPIRARGTDGVEVVGFIGRRNPEHDGTRDPRIPKYLNTGQTSLYTKGEHLYGLTEAGAALSRGGLGVLVEGPIDALAVAHASRGMMAGIAALGTALTERQAALLRAALDARSDRIVVATDADPAGQAAERRAYEVLTGQGLDPRGAALPAGLDPAEVHELHGPAALVDHLASAEPLGRQLVQRALAGNDRRWAEDELRAAKIAAGILVKAPSETWPREVVAVAVSTGLDRHALTGAIIDAVETDTDALGRLSAHGRRDDLDRAKYMPFTAADVAAMSASRATSLRPAGAPATDEAPRPAATSTRAMSARR